MNTSSISKDSENYQNDDCLENETQNKDLNNKETKKKGRSQKTSWIWKWFESVETDFICKVEVVKGQLCNKHYKNGNSTGNLITHLASKHKIMNNTKKHNYVIRKNF